MCQGESGLLFHLRPTLHCSADTGSPLATCSVESLSGRVSSGSMMKSIRVAMPAEARLKLVGESVL